MRRGGRILADTLQKVASAATPGVSTKQLSDIANEHIRSMGGQPSFPLQDDYPEAMCISINDELVHGLPKPKKIIKDGDVVGLDVGVVYKGMITDGATTAYIGKKPSADIERLLEGTNRALAAGISAVKGDGTRVGDIGSAVQKTLDKYRLSVIRDLVGHGVGDKVHENPNIPNYGVAGTGPKLSAGMTICIEPMASLGDWQITTDPDGWTVVTRDGSLSAHFEHTILITEKGAEILTLTD